MRKLIAQYFEAIKKTMEAGEKICNKFVEVLKPVIPDIECSLGWEEAGVDMICLWSSSHSIESWNKRETSKYLLSIIEDVFPELIGYIDTPYGIYLTEEEAYKIEQILTGIVEEEKNG